MGLMSGLINGAGTVAADGPAQPRRGCGSVVRRGGGRTPWSACPPVGRGRDGCARASGASTRPAPRGWHRRTDRPRRARNGTGCTRCIPRSASGGRSTAGPARPTRAPPTTRTATDPSVATAARRPATTGTRRTRSPATGSGCVHRAQRRAHRQNRFAGVKRRAQRVPVLEGQTRLGDVPDHLREFEIGEHRPPAVGASSTTQVRTSTSSIRVTSPSAGPWARPTCASARIRSTM